MAYMEVLLPHSSIFRVKAVCLRPDIPCGDGSAATWFCSLRTVLWPSARGVVVWEHSHIRVLVRSAVVCLGVKGAGFDLAC